MDSAPKSMSLRMPRPLFRVEGSVWVTVKARLPGAAGVSSPGHASTDSPGTWESLPVPSCMIQVWFHLTARDQASGGTDAPAEGANQHLAEEVGGGRGQPETTSEGLGGILRVHSTGEGGELAQAGTHWREGVNKRTYRMKET